MLEQNGLKVPDNLEECQRLIVNMHEQLQSVQSALQELLRNRYGKKSESISEGQLRLFEESPSSDVENTAEQLSEIVALRKACL
jgi:hypothetical protein